MVGLRAILGRSGPKPGTVFSAADFKLSRSEGCDDCDIVMKGGVTSGVVYPYAILELARRYRFRSVGGTSAGGIAAAFAAAAEFARQRGDHEGFVRLESCCLELPVRLRSLFQAEPVLRPLMTIAMGVSRGGRVAVALAVLSALWFTIAVGAAIGAGLSILAGGEPATTILSGLLGAVILLAVRVWRLVAVDLKRNDFGLCRGLGGNPAKPALTQWLYDSLQFIAWGSAAETAAPLTFGDLESRNITLKMMTTNLSLRRPHALPGMIKNVAFEEKRWENLFPKPVMAHIRKTCPKVSWGDYRACPDETAMPVLMAVRMSLSFPFLISAIPMVIRDLGAEFREMDRRKTEVARTAAAGTTPAGIDAPPVMVAQMWFSDGGLTSNFPIHFFDAPLPQRPTFALSLDDLPKGEAPPPERVRTQMKADEGIFLPITEVRSVLGFGGALLGASKDWQDTLLAGMPGQRERIVRVSLAEDEGGLNLDMPSERSRKLMDYGRKAGEKLKSEFVFEEHKWRRALVAYEQLEKTVEATAPVWRRGFGTWLRHYQPASYKRNTGRNRQVLTVRFQAFADLGARFDPAIRHKADLFPKPPAGCASRRTSEVQAARPQRSQKARRGLRRALPPGWGALQGGGRGEGGPHRKATGRGR